LFQLNVLHALNVDSVFQIPQVFAELVLLSFLVLNLLQNTLVFPTTCPIIHIHPIAKWSLQSSQLFLLLLELLLPIILLHEYAIAYRDQLHQPLWVSLTGAFGLLKQGFPILAVHFHKLEIYTKHQLEASVN